MKKSCQIPLILQICGVFDEIFLYVPKTVENLWIIEPFLGIGVRFLCI